MITSRKRERRVILYFSSWQNILDIMTIQIPVADASGSLMTRQLLVVSDHL